MNPDIKISHIDFQWAALATLLVDSTVQEKAVAHPTDSKLLETARAKLVQVAQGAGIELKQTFAKEGRLLGFKAGRYAHARQFKRMRGVIKRQRTVVGRLVREIEHKAGGCSSDLDLDRDRCRNLLRDYRVEVLLDLGRLDRNH